MGKGKTKRLTNALERLSRKQSIFQSYDSVEDWAIYESPEHKKDVKQFETIKLIVLEKYWKQDIHIAPTALDYIIFDGLKYKSKSELLDFIDDRVTRSHLDKNSVVIFPLHSFGFKYGGLGKLYGTKSIDYQHSNFKIFSQTNSFQESRRNIVEYLKEINFKNRKSLDIGLFRHFYKSRGLKWFKNNPLMVIHFKFSQHENYDNLKFITERINFTTNKLYFLSVLLHKRDSIGSGFSTRNTNNWETLDIKHFLTITPIRGGSTMNCLPIYFRNLMVYDKMHMNIDLTLSNRAVKHWERNAINSLDEIYKGYQRYRLTNEKKYLKFNRIANSLNYFRRAVRSLSKEDATININIAFETLLLDKMESQKSKKMVDRLWKVLKLKINKSTNLKEVNNCIIERNNIVHNGYSYEGNLDFNDIFKTYCRLILHMQTNITSFDSTKPDYISKYYDSQ